jgi:hypothetical protein
MTSGFRYTVFWRGGEVDTIFGFEKEADALEWIKEKSQGMGVRTKVKILISTLLAWIHRFQAWEGRQAASDKPSLYEHREMLRG